MIRILIICFVTLITTLLFFTGVESFVVDQVDPKIVQLKSKLRVVIPDIDKIPMYKGNKSYTLDKRKIYLCLRDENERYYPDNFLLYVIMHELAHYRNKKDWGHTEAFFDEFEAILKKSEEAGVYDGSRPHIQNYCPSKEKFTLFKYASDLASRIV